MKEQSTKRWKKTSCLLGILFGCGLLLGMPNRVVAADTQLHTAADAAYVVSGTTITLQADSGTDIAELLDEALKEAHNLDTADGKASTVYTVKVPAGSYKLSSNLHIYSNTTLNATGSTFQWTGSGSSNLIMTGTSSYNESSACKGYAGFKNITVTGGTWISTATNKSSIFRMFHGTNIKMQNCTLKGGACAHQAEIAAINGFTVDNVTFCDRQNSGYNEEALQLDIPCSTKVYKGVVQDGTVMKNVVVKNCTFRNVSRGVGTHTMLVGAFHENIQIVNNTFENVTQEGIVCLNYKNCKVMNNTIKNCGAGILVQYGKKQTSSMYTTIYDGTKTYKGISNHNANTQITGNVIQTVKKNTDEMAGIKVQSYAYTGTEKGADQRTIAKQNLYMTGVTIRNNSITTAGHGIHLMEVRNAIIDNNTMSSTAAKAGTYDGIFLENDSTGNKITSNVIKNMPRYGIFLMEDSSASVISKNHISSSKDCGIKLYDGGAVTSEIAENVITAPKAQGIFLSTGCSVKSIRANTISNTKESAINLYNKCSVGTIAKNKITNTAVSGIMLSTSSKITGNISGNTITDATDYGIHCIKSSAVKGSVVSNKILKTTWPLYVSTGSKVKIGYNTLSKNSNNKYKVTTSSTKVSGNQKTPSGLKLKSKKKKTVTVSWKKTAKTKSYKVQYSTKKDFSKNVKTLTTTKNSVTLKTSSKKTYYVRVQAKGSLNGMTIYGKYSTVKKITSK